MSTNLQKLNKNELLKIIGKMKKTELINIINIKQNGGSNAIRTPLEFNSKLLEDEKNNNIYVMSNNNIYNDTYNELNKNKNKIKNIKI